MVTPAVLTAELSIEKRWLAFREHLPADVRENLDRGYRKMNFELLAKVRTIDEQTWCDSLSVYIPLSDEAERKWRRFWNSFGTGISQSERDELREEAGKLTKPTSLRAEAVEQDLMQKCEAVEKQFPYLARIVP